MGALKGRNSEGPGGPKSLSMNLVQSDYSIFSLMNGAFGIDGLLRPFRASW